ncbi:mitochondrial carrier domain-containing protein [Chytriomyces sp. MP71]|nr:mitochondrial carrier domain-containing protein [Chytriomyces sp. MP71]
MPPKPSPFADACSGAAGAVFANWLVFPLDVIKTRLQTQNKLVKGSEHYANSLDAFVQIIKKEGIAGLYSGLGAGLFGTVASAFCYFYFYSTIRAKHVASIPAGQEISTPMELIMGALAGALCQCFTLPIAVVTTRQQTLPPGERQSFIETFNTVLEGDGVQGLWKGFKASMILCVNPAITYGMFERVKAIWLKRKAKLGGSLALTSWEVFMVGALSKTLATVVTYPYIMAKVRMQWAVPKSANDLSETDRKSLQYKGSVDVLKKVFATDGLKGWYKGMQTQIVKAVLCQAILFVSREKLLAYTLAVFALLGKGEGVNAVVN